MEKIVYRPMDAADREKVTGMIGHFYHEAGEGEKMNAGKINLTFDLLATHPESGSVFVFERSGALVGYSILINYWSNEYGGNLLTIDELYTVPEWRGQRIGTSFIHYLIRETVNNFVVLRLEVLPYNRRALRLYESLGFVRSDRDFLMLHKSG
jgi:GNAT superfamily N-acetyltransferase